MVVTMKEGALSINRYWPSGCLLLPEGPQLFRLAATSRTIEFETDAEGKVAGLTYTLPNAVHHYRRRP